MYAASVRDYAMWWKLTKKGQAWCSLQVNHVWAIWEHYLCYRRCINTHISFPFLPFLSGWTIPILLFFPSPSSIPPLRFPSIPFFSLGGAVALDLRSWVKFSPGPSCVTYASCSHLCVFLIRQYNLVSSLLPGKWPQDWRKLLQLTTGNDLKGHLRAECLYTGMSSGPIAQ